MGERANAMNFTDEATRWLEDITLWTVRDAQDLVDARIGLETVGVFERTGPTSGHRCVVAALHAETVLAHRGKGARAELIDDAALQRGIDLGESDPHVQRAVNDSQMMPLARSA